MNHATPAKTNSTFSRRRDAAVIRRAATLLFCCLLTGLTGLPRAFATQLPSKTYYARFSIITYNGIVVESQLDLLPVTDEYRAGRFGRFRVTGVSRDAQTIDPVSAARDDAMVQLLTAYGLKSVHATQQLHNALAADKVHMRYEGIIRYPVRILQADITGNPAVCRLEMEIDFSPLTFPDQWSYLSAKNQFKKALTSFLHLFY